jgi:hypothetical protein
LGWKRLTFAASSLSITLAGFVYDSAGAGIAFSSLAEIASLGLGVAWLAMPETRPKLV